MSAHPAAPDLDRLLAALADVEATWRSEPMTPRELVAFWLDLDSAARALTEVVRLVADDAADRVLGEVGVDDDGSPLEREYVSAAGDVVHLAQGYRSTRWQHEALADRLALDVILRDTGEVGRAVPLDLVVRHVAGGWRTTGLDRQVPDWRRYRHRDPARWVIRRGAKP